MSLLEQAKDFLSISEGDLKNLTVLKQKGNVFFLILNKKANTFTKQFIRQIHEQLDIVMNHKGPTALVTLSSGKFFSAGIDMKEIQTMHLEDWRYFLLELGTLIGRMTVFSVPTFCLVKGAAYAGGCMFSFSHDYIYAADQLAFRCSQVELGVHIPPGLNAVVTKRINSHLDFRDMILKAKIFNEKESLEKGIIDGILTKNPLKEIYEKAESMAKYGNMPNFKRLKEETYKKIANECFNRQIGTGVTELVSPPPIPKL